MIPELTTLCYIEKDGCYLMQHRIKKEKDLNKDKYIGVGGHIEYGESPEECLLREVKEETGLTLRSYRARGLITFICGQGKEKIVEYMHLFTADAFEGDPMDFVCDEGELVWFPKEDVYDLEIWEGDKIFFKLLEERQTYFSLKLVYSKDGKLLDHTLFS